MSTAIIHINRNVIQRNARRPHEEQEPPCRVERNGKVVYGWETSILGPSKMVYRPEQPRPCGAKLWIETEDTVGIRKTRDADGWVWL